MLIVGRHARSLACSRLSAGLRALDGPSGSVGIAAVEDHAEPLGELLEQLEDVSVAPARVRVAARA